MGFHLTGHVVRVSLTDERLRGNPGRLLLIMAHHARDADARPWCGKGDDYLAQRLGYPPDSEAGGLAVRRARRALTGLGYVDPQHEPVLNRRHKRHWVLTLPGYTPPTGHQ